MVLGIFLLVSANAKGSSNGKSTETAKEKERFQKTAQEVVKAIRMLDDSLIAQYTSRHGIIVVYRSWDWVLPAWRKDELSTTTAKDDLSTTTAIDRHLLPLDAMLKDQGANLWTEVETTIEIGDLGKEPCRAIMKLMSKHIDDTRDNFHGEEYSTHTFDHWGSRYLGAAVEGKLASNCYWYLLFCYENNHWKLYRIEIVVH